MRPSVLFVTHHREPYNTVYFALSHICVNFRTRVKNFCRSRQILALPSSNSQRGRAFYQNLRENYRENGEVTSIYGRALQIELCRFSSQPIHLGQNKGKNTTYSLRSILLISIERERRRRTKHEDLPEVIER